MTPARAAVLGGVVLAVAALAAALAIGTGSQDRTGTDGPPVPDLTFERFDGQEVSLDDYEGQHLVVNFWASWCPPCVAEMPDLEEVHQQHAGDVAFLGINTQDSPNAAQQLAERTGVSYDLAWDPEGDLFEAFEVFGIPSTFLVSPDGRIVHRHTGILTSAQLNELIDEHLEL